MALGVKGIGGNEVRTGGEIGLVNLADDLLLSEAEEVVVADQIARPVGEPITPEVGLAEVMPLDHRAHRAVHDEQPVAEQRGQVGGRVGAHRHGRHYASSQPLSSVRAMPQRSSDPALLRDPDRQKQHCGALGGTQLDAAPLRPE